MQYVVAVTILAACLGFIEGSLVEDHPILLKHREVCKEKSQVSDEVLQEAIKKNLKGDDRNLQCYAKCMIEQVKAMDDKGTIDFTEFIPSLVPKTQAIVGPIMLECQAVVDDPDLCVKAMKMYQCMQEKGKDKYEFA